MDNLYLDSFFFFVPTRLVWKHWQAFNGEKEQLDSTTDYLIPTCTVTNAPTGSLWDYLGLPTNVNKPLKVNALPFRAIWRIWNEWFRDENLQSSNGWGIKIDDGPDDIDANLHWVPIRGKRHDYFTSALPWPQKGPSVDLPLTGDARIYGRDQNTGAKLDVNLTNASFSVGGIPTSNATWFTGEGVSLQDYQINAFADLGSVSAATINSLRQAFQLQKFYEKDARGGTRYTEILRSHFGVVSPDARLQRPEYLGGSSTRINIRPVEQTSSTDTTTPQGNLAAVGVAGDSFHGFTKSFVEHGYLIGFVCVRGDLNYQQGINRLWSREVREDFYWPSFAHLGEQAILNKEIFAQGTDADNDVFGYQERYAEYRYKPNLITGKFRSSDPQSLDVWHLAQDFSKLPVLNDSFIREDPPIKRVIAVQNEPQFLLDAFFEYKCTRPMPIYSVPGLIDHF